jgi:hypothetical protein
MNKPFLTVSIAGLLLSASAWAQINACDLATPFGTIDSADVTAAKNMALGTVPCTATIAVPPACNVVVVQRIVNAMPANGGTCVTGLGAIPHGVTLTWGLSGTSGVTYNVYRATSTNGYTATPLVSLPAGTITYIDTTVVAGLTYFYVIRAVDPANSSNLSTPTNEISAAIPAT